MESASHHALQGCVSSLRSSMQLLESSINILDSGVGDYPRLATVLQATRHFELVTQYDLILAQSTLLSEIQPEVTNLISRVETYLDKLQRREQSLIAKADLQEGRLARPNRTSQHDRCSCTLVEKRNDGTLSGMDEARVQQLKQKKERLSYAVGRLELQATQRQRQLRKSMAA